MLAHARRFVSRLALVAVSIIFIVFAATNRAPVDISLFPLPYSASPPLFLLLLACVAIGVILGGLSVHLGMSRNKRIFKHEHKRNVALQNELDVLHAHMQEQPTALPRR